MDIGVSPEVLKQIAEAEAKVAGKESSPQSLKDIERQMVMSLSSTKAGHECHCILLLCKLSSALQPCQQRCCKGSRCTMMMLTHMQ